LNAHGVSDVRLIQIHTVEPLVPDPSPLRLKLLLQSTNQIPAELIQAGCEILCSKIHKLINSIWNKEKLPDQWKECIIVPVHKKGDKNDCSKYCGISLLSISFKILSCILLSILSLYADKIIGVHQCGF
jgi:hypothetical protein